MIERSMWLMEIMTALGEIGRKPANLASVESRYNHIFLKKKVRLIK